MPLVIALTKWDLVPDNEKAVEAAWSVFGGLVDAVAKTQHIHGALIPLSTGQNPMNVAYPVLWCLYIGIAMKAASLTKAIEQHQATAQTAAAKDTWWDRVSSKYKGEPSWRDIRIRTLTQIRSELAELEPLIGPSEQLRGLLGPVLTF